ncbi:BLUF domain-containing protein [Amaricoccus sp. W119]|uniref:BLUF domain-containing protein n=1 Tax=Amaricoccus sp. W119 TaxID=3391833 RepID=UPI0039A4DD37
MRVDGGASLVDFSFVSRVQPDLPEAALRRIARAANDRNRRLGLTGMLAFADGVFQQVIQGPCETVMLVACRILADARHEGIEVTRFEPIEHRTHLDWRVFGLDGSEHFCALLDGAPPRSPAYPEGAAVRRA